MLKLRPCVPDLRENGVRSCKESGMHCLQLVLQAFCNAFDAVIRNIDSFASAMMPLRRLLWPRASSLRIHGSGFLQQLQASGRQQNVNRDTTPEVPGAL